jgi:hypothetical protein
VTDPPSDRPQVPSSGIPDSVDGLLPWTWARERLEAAITYWLSTTRPDGRPHCIPIWGVWLDENFWFEGGLTTRWARNLATNPAVAMTVHVDDATAVIVEGVASDRSDPGPALASRLVAAFGKYRRTRWAYEADPSNWRRGSGGALWCLEPRTVLGWSRFPEDATRWRLG